VSSVANSSGDEVATPAVSVIVCSHNGAGRLGDTLASLDHQSLSPERYEVLVVDDGSTDGTSTTARARGFRVLRLDRKAGLPAARNAGLRATRGEIVAFTDDDCEPDPDWLAAVLDGFSASDADGLGGPVVPQCPNAFLLGYLEANNPLRPLRAELLASGPLRRLGLYLARTMVGEGEPAAGELLYSVVGANMAFRRRLLCELGGFDEALASCGEEEELCRRAHAQPRPIALRYAPAQRVNHNFLPRVYPLLRRARSYGRGNARAAVKHPEMRPIVYPFPLAVAALLTAGVLTRRMGLLAAGGLLPLASYPRWVRAVGRSRSLEPLAYPFLEVWREAFTMVGELQGRRGSRGPRS
jgi:glycosyltransferase involved in cell wall biosynthesis